MRQKRGDGLKILPPCTFGEPIIEYLNSQTVKTALHIPNNAFEWDLCSEFISTSYERGEEGSVWLYKYLKNKYRVLLYSGDADGAVPLGGTLKWVTELNWTIKEEWRPYKYDNFVAGYLQRYDGLDLLTIHGAGHMAPQSKRPQSYYAIFNWMFNRTI